MSFSLANLLREHARDRPTSLAFSDGARELTFGELDERSWRVAAALLAAGVHPGDRVALLMKNDVRFFEVLFACSKVDAVAVGLNWRLNPRELATILDDARPTVTIVDQEHEPSLTAADAGGSAGHVVVLGEQYESWLSAAPAERPDVTSGPDSLAVILYSSGTTGRPKGITLSNRNISKLGTMAGELFRMRPDGVHLVASPLFHVGGMLTGLTMTALGGRTVLVRDATPALLLELIERERVTNAFFVPAVIQRLTELTESGGHDLSSLETIAYGAAPMTETLLRRAMKALGCGFVGCYGMTETSGTVLALPPDEHVFEGPDARLLRSVGRPLSWAEVEVRDMRTGQVVPDGEVGEIWVRSEANMVGYFNQPEATAEALVDGGWLRTGDGALRDEQGYFFLQDRIKDMIITGGENVYPAEVENVLAEHRGVAEVAVIGIPDAKWGETVKAVVVPRAGQTVTAAELIDFSRSRLAHYKCPTSVEVVDVLPRSATDKVLKNVLRDTYS
ncbi:MAG: fatty acid--CoA ligase [Acidimicrobiales bacterium]